MLGIHRLHLILFFALSLSAGLSCRLAHEKADNSSLLLGTRWLHPMIAGGTTAVQSLRRSMPDSNQNRKRVSS
jgi:hypothetical protein